MSMLNRSDVPVEETWNLEDLFATEQAYTAAIEEIRQLAEETAEGLAGTITDVQGAINAIEATEKFRRKWLLSAHMRAFHIALTKQAQTIKCVPQALVHLPQNLQQSYLL